MILPREGFGPKGSRLNGETMAVHDDDEKIAAFEAEQRAKIVREGRLWQGGFAAIGLALVGLAIWNALETRATRNSAHDDADALLRAVAQKGG